MKRYEKFVLEAEKGITFEVSEETRGELIIKAKASNDVYPKFPHVSAGEYAMGLSVYTDKDGNKAVVPPEWTVSAIKKENTIWGKNLGLVIYRIPKEKICDIDWTNPDEVETLKRTYDQLVWTPVSLLEANGTLDDGFSFNEKFGRRNYQDDEFSDEEFNEALNGELLEQDEV